MTALDCQLPLAEVYAKVDLTETDATSTRILRLREDDATYLAGEPHPGYRSES